MHASVCLSARACLYVCALVWGRSTCSVVSVKERAELATLYVQTEVTAQAQWIPLRQRMRGSPFWAPRNRWERGVNSTEHLYTQCHHPTLGLDVRNGWFVQSPEVGLRWYCCASLRRYYLLRDGRFVLFLLTKKCMIFESCLHRCHVVVRLFLCRGARKRVCTLCEQQENWT